MAASFERVITVTVTPKVGEAFTLTGQEASSFYQNYVTGQQLITVVDPETGARTTYNSECICSVKWESVKGDDYVKPECDPLYCPPEAPAPDPEP